jgi:hypothetical protein
MNYLLLADADSAAAGGFTTLVIMLVGCGVSLLIAHLREIDKSKGGFYLAVFLCWPIALLIAIFAKSGTARRLENHLRDGKGAK